MVVGRAERLAREACSDNIELLSVFYRAWPITYSAVGRLRLQEVINVAIPVLRRQVGQHKGLTSTSTINTPDRPYVALPQNIKQASGGSPCSSKQFSMTQWAIEGHCFPEGDRQLLQQCAQPRHHIQAFLFPLLLFGVTAIITAKVLDLHLDVSLSHWRFGLRRFGLRRD